jgi:hypothetical protein
MPFISYKEENVEKNTVRKNLKHKTKESIAITFS